MNKNESQMYRVYEMKDELTKGIDSLERMIGDQETLVSFIKSNSGDEIPESIGNLVTELENQITTYNKQLESLRNRKDLFENFLNWFETNSRRDEIDENLSLMFAAMFSNGQN